MGLFLGMHQQGPIGVFDSGYGGLTVLKEIVAELPQYHYLYLGDNARAPYGTRSYETVYQYTWQCVQWFFQKGCRLVILACNTASAKALRTIQQKNLPINYPQHRVLGVIRPTAEVIGNYTQTNKVGVLGTKGTIQSNSYVLEIEKFFPEVTVYQEACPMWVPLVENNEHLSAGADYFIQKNIQSLLSKNKDIDTFLLACTHYPLLAEKIKPYLPPTAQLISQGNIVAKSLSSYLERHTAIEQSCIRKQHIDFYTTDDVVDFEAKASIFWGEAIQANTIHL